MRLRGHRMTALMLLALYLGSCTRWEPTPVSPRALIEGERPPRVRIVGTNGSRTEVAEPIIRNDSIGSARGCARVLMPDGRAECVAPRLTIALADVRGVELRRTYVPAGVAVVALPLAALGLVVYLLLLQGFAEWDGGN